MKKLLLLCCLVGCTSNNPGDSSAPHALGTIVLGESHPSTGGNSSPVVSASFIPDAQLTSCSAQIGGCEMTIAPECQPLCALGEFCTFDEGCNAVCKKPCTKVCNNGEVCVFDGANQPTCVLTPTFDAGPLAFSGTTTAITLFPPYVYQASQQGAPFLAGASLEVQAQGASGAGFAAFDEKYSATTFLQTLVPLDQIPRTTLFGADAVPIDWVAGGDRIVITVSGQGGTAVCTAADAAGHYDVAREVVNAAIGTGTTLGLVVSRQRKETHKGLHAMGPLPTGIVQPEGWLDLVTLSSESAGFTGCGVNGMACGTGAACVDVMTDQLNCGGCDVKCASSQICVSGQCTDPVMACNDCFDAAQTGKCKAQNTACANNADCAALRTCIDGCADQNCVNDCFNAHTAAASLWDSFISCVCQTACTNECAGQC